MDLEQRRRRFTGWLAELIRWRDLVCRDPYCGAPIRHLDHIHRHTDGGPTTPANGRGMCERGNYVRELPGWTVRLLDPDDHTVVTITPTRPPVRLEPTRATVTATDGTWHIPDQPGLGGDLT